MLSPVPVSESDIFLCALRVYAMPFKKRGKNYKLDLFKIYKTKMPAALQCSSECWHPGLYDVLFCNW